jgi:hypothetical protein
MSVSEEVRRELPPVNAMPHESFDEFQKLAPKSRFL